MDTFKEIYSQEELNEIAEWFEGRMDKLPPNWLSMNPQKRTIFRRQSRPCWR